MRLCWQLLELVVRGDEAAEGREGVQRVERLQAVAGHIEDAQLTQVVDVL